MLINCQPVIDRLLEKIKSEENAGNVATYIPELGKVDPEKFGVSLITLDNQHYAAGDAGEKFSIQSIAKVLSLCLAFKCMGDDVWERVDVEPSGTPFNSLLQLESEDGIPRNPLINAGAIVICDMLISHLNDPKNELIEFVRKVSNNTTVDYSETIAASEKSEGYRNVALVSYLRALGNIENDVMEVLDLYFYLSSITMTCEELSRAFLFLANRGQHPETGEQVLSEGKTKRVNAIMQTCGFYDEAGEFAYKVGMPGKSGVGGGIVAVLPDHYAVTVWSPRLNAKGNSCRGMKFLEEFTDETEASVF